MHRTLSLPIPQAVLALKVSDGVAREWLWLVLGSVLGGGRSFLSLFTVLGDTYPQKQTVKSTFLGNVSF